MTSSISNRSDRNKSANDDQSIGQDPWQIARAHARNSSERVSFSENYSKDPKAHKEEASVKILSVFWTKWIGHL